MLTDRDEIASIYVADEQEEDTHSIVSTLLRRVVSAARAVAKHAVLARQAEMHSRSQAQKQRYMKRGKIQSAHRTHHTTTAADVKKVSRQMSARSR